MLIRVVSGLGAAFLCLEMTREAIIPDRRDGTLGALNFFHVGASARVSLLSFAPSLEGKLTLSNTMCFSLAKRACSFSYYFLRLGCQPLRVKLTWCPVLGFHPVRLDEYLLELSGDSCFLDDGCLATCIRKDTRLIGGIGVGLLWNRRCMACGQCQFVLLAE
jgi:hypothetical protein